MNILYIHQYFRTPEEPGGTRSYWISKELLNQGHCITMLTSNEGRKNVVGTKNIDGIEVIYLDVDYSQNMSIIKRLYSFLRFMIHSTRTAFALREIDLVIATSTPLTVGIPALFLKKIRKIPFIFEVRDLWPEVPIQMGALRNPLLQWASRYLEKVIYKNASHIVALSPGMEDGVLKYVSADRVSMIPNMAKIGEFWPRQKNERLRKDLGLKENAFKIIHFGSIGLANGIKTVIESAEILKDDKTVEFVFIGGGSQEKELKDDCERKGLRNVYFLGGFPMKETSEIVNLCDVSIVSFLDIPILYTNSPNKLFDSLSAGKPVIVNSKGWTKDLVEKYNCGFYVDPHRPEDFVRKIKWLQANADVATEMGRESRLLAETEFDKGILCKKFARLVDEMNVKQEIEG